MEEVLEAVAVKEPVMAPGLGDFAVECLKMS